MSITTATAGSRPRTGVDARDRIFYSGMALALSVPAWLMVSTIRRGSDWPAF